MLKDPNEIPLDFSRFLKKIHEIESQKSILPLMNDEFGDESVQKRYIRKYSEKIGNCIRYNRK